MSWTCDRCGHEVSGKSGSCHACGLTRWHSQASRNPKFPVQVLRQFQTGCTFPTRKFGSPFFQFAATLVNVLSLAAYLPMLFSVTICMKRFAADIGSGRGGHFELAILSMFSCLGLSVVSSLFSASAAIRFIVAGVSPVILYVCLRAWWDWYYDFHGMM